MLSMADQAKIQQACSEAIKKIEDGDYGFYIPKKPSFVRAATILIDGQVVGYMVKREDQCIMVEADVFEKDFEKAGNQEEMAGI